MRGEREKLLHMEDVLRKRVVGQDEAITVSTRSRQLYNSRCLFLYYLGCIRSC